MKWLCVALVSFAALTGCQTGGGGPKMGTSASGAKLPYAKPVPGKVGLVYSPYSENNVWIDVRGFKRGTEVQDPWTEKLFLVP